MTNNTKNPWAGLASYEDPTKSERKQKFCGRDNEIYDVTRLIDDNLLLILYGKSGIGKTSLLNAGVFPKLRSEQYLPVSVRLGILEEDVSYQEAIIAAIDKALEEIKGNKIIFNVVEEQPDNQSPDWLWNYFARHRFSSAEMQPLFPVVILDQFEEVLRNSSPEHIGKAQMLLNQIQYLIDESHALNDCIVEGKEYYYDFNFRFVISIREDELYLLEDNIDDLSLGMFRNCRYRLRSLSKQGATEAILVPGKDCIADEEKQAVVDRVIELSKRPQSNDIDTLLLSLVCAGTYDKKAREKIALSDLSIWKDNPMEEYYKESVKGLTADQVRYIQQHLIREDGSRKQVAANEVKTALGESTYHQLTQGKNKLLTIGDKGKVELLHDQLGLAIYEERKAFEERERKKKFRRRITVIGIIVLAIAGIFWSQNAKLKKKDQEMRTNLMRFVAEKSMALTDDGDSYSGRILALELLLNKSERSIYLPEAEAALRHACNQRSAIIKGHTGYVDEVHFSNDDNLILSCSSEDSTVKLWDAISGLCIKQFSRREDNINLVSASFIRHDSSIITYSDNGKSFIWDIETGKVIEEIDGFCQSISTDNKYLLVYTNDKWEVWNAETLEHEKEIDASKWYPLIWYPDNQWLLVLSQTSKNEFYRVNISTEESVSLFYDDLEAQIFCVEIAPMGDQIAIGYRYKDDRPGYVIIRDAKSGELLHTLRGGQGLNGIAYSPDGKKIAVTSMDGLVRLWDADNGAIINVLSGHTFASASPCFSHDGNCLMTSSADHTIRIFDVSNYINNTNDVIGKHDNVSSISCHPDGKLLLVAYYDSLCVYDAIEKLWIKTLQKDSVTYEAVFSPKGDMVAVRYRNSVGVLNLSTGTWPLTIPGNNQFAFNHDGTKLVTSCRGDSTIYIWNVHAGNRIDNIPWSHRISQIVFIGNDDRVLVESLDGIISNLDGKHYHLLNFWKAPVSLMKHSGDGKFVLTKNNDEVFVWETETGDCLNTLRHNSSVKAFAFSHDGRYIVTTTHDLMVNIWSRESGVRLFSTKLHQYSDVQFCPDNNHVVLMNQREVRILDFPPLHELIDQTRERFKDRPLTPEERRMYYLE